VSDGADVPREAAERVVHALLRPAARLALDLGVPLKQLVDWLQMAMFQEARARGLKLREVADALDVSPRTAALLSKRLKLNFLDVEAEVELPRRVEFLLWAAPLSVPRIVQTLPEVPEAEIRQAIGRLVAEGRVREVPGPTTRYAVVRSAFRLVGERGWLSRIDGLNNLLGSVRRAVSARFFGGPDAQARSLARTIGLRLREVDLPKLRELYEKTLWPALVALDDAAREDDDSVAVDVSVVWAPQDEP